MKKSILTVFLIAALLCGCTAAKSETKTESASKTAETSSDLSAGNKSDSESVLGSTVSSESSTSAAKESSKPDSTSAAAESSKPDSTSAAAESSEPDNANAEIESSEPDNTNAEAESSKPDNASAEVESSEPDNTSAAIESSEPDNTNAESESPETDNTNTSEESTDDSSVDSEDPFAGRYAESIAGRGVITVTNAGDNIYTVSVSWASSAFENAEWELSGEFNGRGVLYYTNCKKTVTTYDDQGGSSSETIYTEGTGYMQMGNIDGGGVTIAWNDDIEHIADDSIFLKQ